MSFGDQHDDDALMGSQWCTISELDRIRESLSITAEEVRLASWDHLTKLEKALKLEQNIKLRQIFGKIELPMSTSCLLVIIMMMILPCVH